MRLRVMQSGVAIIVDGEVLIFGLNGKFSAMGDIKSSIALNSIQVSAISVLVSGDELEIGYFPNGVFESKIRRDYKDLTVILMKLNNTKPFRVLSKEGMIGDTRYRQMLYIYRDSIKLPVV